MSDPQDPSVSIQYIICECGANFSSVQDLQKHRCAYVVNEFKCGVCGEIYPTEALCLVHYDSAHGDVAFPDDHDYVGESSRSDVKAETSCEDGVDSKEGILEQYPLENLYEGFLQEEIVNDTNETLTEMQELTYLDGSDITVIPIKSEESTHESTDLEKYKIKTKVKQEKPNNMDLPNEIVQQIKILKEGAMKMELIQNQLKSKTRAKRNPNNPKRKTQNIRKEVCEVCGKSYASNAALRYHQRVHTGERPYQCPLCPRTFTMRLFLQVHHRTHTGERPFQCSTCPKAFSNKAALLRHDRVHTGIKPYVCPKCGKAFTQSNSMKLHIMTVHLKQPTPYKSKSRKMREREKEAEMDVDVDIEYRDIAKEYGLPANKLIIIKRNDRSQMSNKPMVKTEPNVNHVQHEVKIEYEPANYEPEDTSDPEDASEAEDASELEDAYEHDTSETQGEILYEDVDPEQIAYEVVYDDT